MNIVRTQPVYGTTLRSVDFGAGYGDPESVPEEVGDDIAKANIICSDGPDDMHKVIIDVDLPAQLIPSTTPGHYHLYIDHWVPAPEYFNMLNAMAAAGIVQQGYVEASAERGYTAARLPWIKKENANEKY